MTKVLRERVLPQWRQEQVELWMHGAFTNPLEAGTLQQNAKAIGICETVNKLLELDFIALKGAMDDEQERTEAAGPGSPGQDV